LEVSVGCSKSLKLSLQWNWFLSCRTQSLAKDRPGFISWICHILVTTGTSLHYLS
jgi:hypothetical protein